MKKIYLYLTLLMFCATASYAQGWQMTITAENGLPGDNSTGNYVFTSGTIKPDSPTNVIRITSISNDVFEAESGQAEAMNRFSAGICDVVRRQIFGNQHPVLSIAELVVYDAEGNSIPYTPKTNSPEPDGGFMAAFGMGGYQSPFISNINDGNEGTRYISTNYALDKSVTAKWPDRFPYVELELGEAVEEFSFKLVMPSNGPHATHLGITSGTDYMPYDNIQFTLGDPIQSDEEIESLTSYVIIKGNAPVSTASDVTYPGELFMTSSYGGTKDCTAASLAKFIPAGDGYYYIYWIASELYLADSFNASMSSTNNVAYATKVYTLSNGEGQFEIITSDGKNLIHDLKGYIKPQSVSSTSDWDSSTMGGIYFTIYNASTDVKVAIESLEKAIADAEARIERYNGEMAGDEGEFAALQEAIKAGKELLENGGTFSEYTEAEAKINEAVFNYVRVRAYDLSESLYELTDSEEIVWFDKEPVIGGYPYKELEKLEEIYNSIIYDIEDATGIGELETYIEYIENVLAEFYATKVEELVSLPIYADSDQGLPGEIMNRSYYRWESPVFALDKAIDGMRITFTKSRGTEEYNNFPSYAFAEYEFYNPDGTKIDLTAYDFTTNSTSASEPLDNICDGNYQTFYQSATSRDALVAPSSEVYIEVTFPEPLQAFYIVHTSRDQFSLPLELALTSKGELYTKHLFSENTWNATLGEQVTDVNEIKENEIYALRSAGEGSYWIAGTEKFDEKVLRGECAFRLVKNSDGTFRIKSLSSAGYWADTKVEQSAYSVIFDECAANLNIVAGSNEGSFRIYNQDGEEGTPYFIYHSGNKNVNVKTIESLDDFTSDNEWLIYRITMDTPEYFYLTNIKEALADADIKVAAAPGFFSVVSDEYTAAVKAVDECLSNSNKAKAAEVASMIDKAIDNVDDNNRNAISTETEYRIRSAFKPFYDNQSVYKELQYDYDNAIVRYYTCSSEPDETFYFIFEKDETDVNTYLIMSKCDQYSYLNCSNGYLELLEYETIFNIERIAGSAKYRISDYYGDGRYLCASTHQDGKNSWAIAQFESISSSPEATKWYILDDNTATSAIESVVVEGDSAISTVYYTANGMLLDKPVKGINIVKTVYANGVVTTKKVLVK